MEDDAPGMLLMSIFFLMALAALDALYHGEPLPSDAPATKQPGLFDGT